MPHEDNRLSGEINPNDAKLELRTQVNQEVIYRSHETGAKITREQWEQERDKYGRHKRQKRHNERRSRYQRIPESELEWGGGLKQKHDLEAKNAREQEIMQGPFAAYDIADSLDKELRMQKRWDDPLERMKEMEEKRRKKKRQSHTTAEVNKKSEASQQERKCPFPGPPNRYGIAPGYRWDGKIRGNGFEEKYLAARSGKLAAMKSYIGTDIKSRF